MANDLPLFLLPSEVQAQLGERLKSLRLELGYKRTTLAERAGVSARSLQRFEDTGEVSLKSLLRLAHAVGRLDGFGALLAPLPMRSLRDLPPKRVKPKRGRI